jgi:predicted alpha/beta-hydrolase family hydrolase
LILTHGAGSNRDAPLLVALDEAFAAIGWKVLRVNLPYRELRPSGPPRAGDAERDRAGLRAIAGRGANEHAGRVFLGGHSYGGRQSSMLAAEAPDAVSGLLLLSYPLHPPRRPDQPRTAHLPSLRTPAFFVHGTRDPFGSIEELRAAIALIPARTELLELPGAGHELVGKKAEALSAAATRISGAFLEFVTPQIDG